MEAREKLRKFELETIGEVISADATALIVHLLYRKKLGAPKHNARQMHCNAKNTRVF